MPTCACQQGPGIQVLGCAQAAAQAASQAILLFLASDSSIPHSGARCASFTEIVPNKEGKNRTDAALDSLVDLLIYFNTD
jgi:hypothetical protein